MYISKIAHSFSIRYTHLTPLAPSVSVQIYPRRFLLSETTKSTAIRVVLKDYKHSLERVDRVINLSFYGFYRAFCHTLVNDRFQLKLNIGFYCGEEEKERTWTPTPIPQVRREYKNLTGCPRFLVSFTVTVTVPFLLPNNRKVSTVTAV